MSETSGHDNVDVRVNSKINIYGSVIFLGGLPLLVVGFIFLAIFLTRYWEQAVTLAAIIIYGIVTAFGLAVIALLAALWIRLVVHPSIDARERKEAIRGQEQRNRVIWAQSNCLIYEEQGELIPLFPEHPLLIEAPKTVAQEEAKINEALVLELYDQATKPTYQNVADALSTSYHQIQKVCSAAVRNGHRWKNR